ncbi:MAG TPA: ribosome assembly RNA-binding protein YhbY [Desulfosporosinus sp.]|nr:ribosome assembly RNA-binding protein YhbY [Desulfosporosinus sp.]
MLTGKQKGFLRSMGNEMDPILQVGKGGITEAVITQTDEVLEVRELIKCRVLQNCSEEPKSVAAELAEHVQADLVQVIGRNFLLFRQSKDKPVLVLPR